MTWDVIVGDCRDVMATMDSASVDAIVTDPPYELGFMGKAWDRSGVAFDAATWAAAYRVLKPGGHLLAFGGSRTFHRIAVAIEDAGFEIRDTISWLYGSGFPKSHDVSKAIDKMAGAEREVLGPHPTNSCPGGEWCNCQTDGRAFHETKHAPLTAPATDLARDWQGWGTALKPGWEPVIVARKPFAGTVAQNVTTYGTGALNIDGCRIGDGDDRCSGGASGAIATPLAYGVRRGGVDRPTGGRWPANVMLDDDAAAMLDEQSGNRPSSDIIPGGGRIEYDGVDGFFPGKGYGKSSGYGDRGGASRFFYVAKASTAERNAGFGEQNHHPTVKPISLMRYLVRLVTPPGGVVLDPFTGSGTTGCAAALEGFTFVGVEQSPEYAAIAEARIAHWGQQIPLEIPR